MILINCGKSITLASRVCATLTCVERKTTAPSRRLCTESDRLFTRTAVHQTRRCFRRRVPAISLTRHCISLPLGKSASVFFTVLLRWLQGEQSWAWNMGALSTPILDEEATAFSKSPTLLSLTKVPAGHCSYQIRTGVPWCQFLNCTEERETLNPKVEQRFC